MNLHRNARLTPHGRRLLVERVCRQHVPLARTAAAAGISTRTASKWVTRYRREGNAGLEDRSSAPHRVPRRTGEERVTAITALRRVRMTAAEISELLGMPLSTVSAVLLRIGLGKRR
jgi:transposase-like protein